MRLLYIALVWTTAAGAASAETLRAAVAISLKDALTAVQPRYEAATGDTLQFSFGASGQLAAQIRNGAPVDLFISAAQKQVDELVTSGHGDPPSQRIVAGNSLVLIVPAAAKGAPVSFRALGQVTRGRIAIGEPASVPAGDYAMEVFTTLKLTDSLSGKLVLGTNVRQVLAYVENGEVAAGIVYSTDARQSGEKVRVVASADPAWHKPIVYPGIVVKGARSPDAARRFLDYLQSPEARTALTSRGFTVPSVPATQPSR